MVKCEFSETQFVMAFLREALTDESWRHFPILPWIWSMPSTHEEAEFASDFILRDAASSYSHSIFYQFKRSNLFNYETFTDLTQNITIDTKANPHYSFKIYNTSKTQQFDKLRILAQNANNEVYYCAPLFHEQAECMYHFRNSSVLANAKLFDFKCNQIQKANVPLDSNHIILFNMQNNYLCSDINEIDGFIAKEKLFTITQQYSNKSYRESDHIDLETLFSKIQSILPIDSIDKRNNIFNLRDTLLNSLNIFWIPYFNLRKYV